MGATLAAMAVVRLELTDLPDEFNIVDLPGVQNPVYDFSTERVCVN